MSKWGVYLMSLSIILFPSLSCPTNIQVEVAYSTRSCDFRYEEVDSECLFDICYYRSSSSSKADPLGVEVVLQLMLFVSWACE